jgi:molybdopterin molybdotransferase
MLSVAEARAAILQEAAMLGSEHAELRNALRRTLREDVIATRPQPPFPASAMDGYALRAADTPGLLRIVGEAGAGRALEHALASGECARIFTGAALPQGADSVLIQEDAVRAGEVLTAPSVARGRHVRDAGIDFKTGDRLVQAGRVLDAPAIALAAAAGKSSLLVSLRPKVAILGGGDEIVSPGQIPAPDQIFDSLSYGVAALAETWGAQTWRSSPLRDERKRIAEAMAQAAPAHDVMIVIGGASVGDHDHARPALQSLGGAIVFEKIAVRPGKPTWLARLEGKLVLGLPGNPASALVCARLFLRPLLDRLCGRDPDESTRLHYARLRDRIDANGARETYLRARLDCDENGQTWAATHPNQDSSLLSVMGGANALLKRAPHATEATPGSVVEALFL